MNSRNWESLRGEISREFSERSSESEQNTGVGKFYVIDADDNTLSEEYLFTDRLKE